MSFLEILTLIAHFSILGALVIFGLHRYRLVWLARHKDANVKAPSPSDADDLPNVTIQLPIYNERYVVERLIEHVCSLNYPCDKLHIQVLDDSTDDTSRIVSQAINKWQKRGFEIEHYSRTERIGFKAGALAAGLDDLDSDFVAIFDADFLPRPDFLHQTLPHFDHDDVGMVQARWQHINRTQSLLTRAQAVLLDGHFRVEHYARHKAGLFFNFNGTAGIWRRQCILSAGGWHHETITEDLDLSYRAQLAGWKFVYLDDVDTPAELPSDMNAFKTQQHRWAKGSIQVARKLLPKILKSSIPMRIKIEAAFHLCNNFAYVLLTAMAVLMPLSIRIRAEHQWHHFWFADLPVLTGATLSVFYFYFVSQKMRPVSPLKKVRDIMMALVVGIGLSVNNTRAVIEACLGKRSAFVRTPKLAFTENEDAKGRIASAESSYRGKIHYTSWVELSFALLYLHTLAFCISDKIWSAIPFIGLLSSGYLYTAVLSMGQALRLRSQEEKPLARQKPA